MITPQQRDCSLTILAERKAAHRPVAPAACAAIITDVLQFYWEDKRTAEDLLRQQALWYAILKDHSAATIQKVALDWLKSAKRAPTPADFFELCEEEDTTPFLLTRLEKYAMLPVADQIGHAQQSEKTAMNGCPIILGRMMRFSRDNNIEFTIAEQDQYLSSGIQPPWFAPIAYPVTHVESPMEAPSMPTREELLAQMSPEARLSALRKD